MQSLVIGDIASECGEWASVTIEVGDSGARMPPAVDERDSMRSVEFELHVEFPSVPIDRVTSLVRCLWARFDGASVRDFVPLLVRKQAKEELRDHLGPWAEVTVSSSDPSSAAHPRLATLRPESVTP